MPTMGGPSKRDVMAMSELQFFQIDAFASRAFGGNQACVMPMPEGFLQDAELQAIAAENNVAETAFIVPAGEGIWKLRWFTPAVEVPLCGHATLASGHVLFEEMGFAGDQIEFQTVQSGSLFISKTSDGRLQMDFPAKPGRSLEIDEEIVAALGRRPVRAWGGFVYAAMFETPEDVLALKPDLRALKHLGEEGAGWERGNFGCFAPGGEGVDVTSRFFAPGSGIDEDPATGSWHCMLAPVMAEVTGKTSLSCFQAYPSRGAHIETEIVGDRVKITGSAVTVIKGTFRV